MPYWIHRFTLSRAPAATHKFRGYPKTELEARHVTPDSDHGHDPPAKSQQPIQENHISQTAWRMLALPSNLGVGSFQFHTTRVGSFGLRIMTITHNMWYLEKKILESNILTKS